MCGGRIVVSILASAVPLPHANRPPCPSACVPVLCGLMILSIECRWGSRCIAPLVPNLSTVRKWMVSSTLRPFYHSRKNHLVSIPVFSIQKIPISLAQTRFLLILLCHVTQPPICFSEEKFSINPYAFVHCDCWFQYWLQRRGDNPLLNTRAVGPSTFGCPRLLLNWTYLQLLHPQPEDTLCRVDRDPLNTGVGGACVCVCRWVDEWSCRQKWGWETGMDSIFIWSHHWTARCPSSSVQLTRHRSPNAASLPLVRHLFATCQPAVTVCVNKWGVCSGHWST